MRRSGAQRRPQPSPVAVLQPLLEELEGRLPPSLGSAFEALRTSLDRPLMDAVGNVWRHRLLLELPSYLGVDPPDERDPLYAALQEAHGLGWLHGWRSNADRHPDASRLHTYLFVRWRDALLALAPAGAQLNDQLTQSVRWMRWGCGSHAAAVRTGTWDLSGYYRSVRWEARTRVLASEFWMQRVNPGQLAAYARMFDLAALGLRQLHDAEVTGPHSIPTLLDCAPSALTESGLSAIELAGIEAQALGWQRFAGYCRLVSRRRRETR